VTEQLNILGDHAQPTDLQLGPVQRECMRALRELGSLARDEAGALAHEHRGKHHRDDRCVFCGPDGADILKTLARRCLIEREAVSGDARLPTTQAEPDDPDGDGIPY
jgi:hypothetical protein